MSVARALEFFFRDRSPVMRKDGVVFKEVETRYELEQVFRLAYDIYVEDFTVKKNNQITRDERQKKQMHDDWDFRADTRHFIALKNGEAIGAVRVNFNDIPLEHYIHPDNDFLLQPEHQTGRTKTEISHLMIKKKFRNANLLLGLFRFVYHCVKDAEDLYVSNLQQYDTFFAALGGKKLGKFYFDRLNDYYSVHHCYMPDFKNDSEKLIKMGLNPFLRRMVMEPLARHG